MIDPMTLFERAAANAASMAGQVGPEQRHRPTPCADWDVAALLNHMVAGPGYLLTALGVDTAPPDTDEKSYRAAVARSVESLHQPGALDARCMSPAGFEWSVGEAVAGTAMDQLIHTWDLAVAIGANLALDPELVDACVAMFLPQMPEIGRAAGIVGPEVSVPANASAQDRLLGAMGRQP
jgi:uncharacterized protein (TIGR03086 family)